MRGSGTVVNPALRSTSSDGRQPHALLLEIFTDGGIGTEVVR
jgi:acetylglutamate kinase